MQPSIPSVAGVSPVAARAAKTALPAGDYLYMDAASREPFSGVLRVPENGEVLTWKATRRAGGTPATESLFAMLAGLEMHGTALAQLAGFIFAEGPGSILGIRIVAAALRTWQTLPHLAGKPVFAVNNLELAATLLLRATPTLRDFSVVADSRQGFWNVLGVCDGCVSPDFRELPTDALAALPAPCYRIVQRTTSAAPPIAALMFPETALEADPAALGTPGLLRPSTAPDAINLPGSFVKWVSPVVV